MKSGQRENLLKEYESLRNEILNLANLRHLIVIAAITLLGLLLAFAKDGSKITSVLFMVYPVLTLILAINWMHYDCRIGEIGRYIRCVIEPQLYPMNWETQLYQKANNSKTSVRKLALSTAGIFWACNILAATIASLILMVDNSQQKLFIVFNWRVIIAPFIIALVSCVLIGIIASTRRKRFEDECQGSKVMIIKANPQDIQQGFLRTDVGYRKFAVNSLYNDEIEYTKEEWVPPKDKEKSQVILNNEYEFGYFFKQAKQDCHYHKTATEIYTILQGTMKITICYGLGGCPESKINSSKQYTLTAGNSIIIPPGIIHKVLRDDCSDDLLCIVVKINVLAKKDKIVVNDCPFKE